LETGCNVAISGEKVLEYLDKNKQRRDKKVRRGIMSSNRRYEQQKSATFARLCKKMRKPSLTDE
jgi:hypothetical protein